MRRERHDEISSGCRGQLTSLHKMSMAYAAGLALALVTAGCSGNIGEPGLPGVNGNPSGGGSGSGSGGGIGSTTQPVCGQQSPAEIRRLTRHEYDNTLRDLLGITSNPASNFPPDEQIAGFEVGTTVTQLLAEKYIITAEALTKSFDVAPLLPCDPNNGEDACARSFIETIGKKLYRRPLTQTEVDRIVTVYNAGKGAGGFSEGTRWALQTMLQSPNFLYRVELGKASSDPGDAPGSKRLDNYEIAQRLSYILWNSTPDDTLLAAADAGKLQNPDEIEKEARRLLADPRARHSLRNFVTQWLHLDRLDAITKDGAVYPLYSSALAKAMKEETLRFAEHVVFDGDGQLETLLSASYSFINSELAQVYGVQGVTGSDFQRVDLDPAERAGILTHASVLSVNANSNQSSPVYRGHFVRAQILCDPPSPPPDNIVVKPPDLDPSLSTRERFNQHRTDPACRGCHQMMDPIGFAFEHYDGIGQFRSEESPGVAVDASGEFFVTKDLDGKFYGAVEATKKLATSNQVRQCVVTQLFRYAFGRNETSADSCSLAQLNQSFTDSNYNLRELFVALVRSEAFRYRSGGFKKYPGSN